MIEDSFSPLSDARMPVDVATRATAIFIASNLRKGSEIIEVGCGTGEVAAALSKNGYQIIGLDSDQDAVLAARKAGVSALHVSWPDYESDPVDAIVFTRSLHHINPLSGALETAHALLKPAGVVMVEDFAFDETEPACIEWFVSVLNSPDCQSIIEPDRDEFIAALLVANDPVATWLEHHDHHLHSAKEMALAIQDHFDLREMQCVPYLYRYLVNVVPEMREAASFVANTYEDELHRGNSGQFSPIGRRMIGVLPAP